MSKHLPTMAALAICLLAAPAARAQLYTADPYNPSGRAYLSFAYPGAGYNPSLPNHTIFGYGGVGPDAFSSVSPYNQFQSYLDAGPAAPGFSNRAGRYDQSFRAYDDVYERSYANSEQYGRDESYYKDAQARDELYFKALKERDPKKRADMARELERLNRKAANSLGTSVRREGTYTAATAAPGGRARQPEGSASRNLAIAAPGARFGSRPAPALDESALEDEALATFEKNDPLEAFRGRTPYDSLERARRLREISKAESLPTATDSEPSRLDSDSPEPSRPLLNRTLRPRLGADSSLPLPSTSRLRREPAEPSRLGPGAAEPSRLAPPR